MKKVISILLLIILVFSLAACNKSNNTSSELDADAQSDISSVDTSSQSSTISNEELASGQSSCEEKIKPANNTGEYTVTFDYGYDNKKTTAKSQNNKIEEPKKPIRNGFEFNGWYFEETKWIFPAFDVCENLTLTAKWSPNKYNISYKLNNENITTIIHSEFTILKMFSNSTENEFNCCIYYYPSEEITVLPINSPDFIGWTYNGNDVPINNVVIPAGKVYGDLEFVAHWK